MFSMMKWCLAVWFVSVFWGRLQESNPKQWPLRNFNNPKSWYLIILPILLDFCILHYPPIEYPISLVCLWQESCYIGSTRIPLTIDVSFYIICHLLTPHPASWLWICTCLSHIGVKFNPSPPLQVPFQLFLYLSPWSWINSSLQCFNNYYYIVFVLNIYIYTHIIYTNIYKLHTYTYMYKVNHWLLNIFSKVFEYIYLWLFKIVNIEQVFIKSQKINTFQCQNMINRFLILF